MGELVGVAVLPGLPHLLAEDPAPSWRELREAAESYGRDLRAAGAEALMIMSTQWFTVLGHNFQVRPRLSGRYVDENWYAYDYGAFDYDVCTEGELTRAWAREVADSGFQAHLTDYDRFPVDTGTLVVRRLVDPDGRLPVAQMSCNLYADGGDMERLGHAGARAVRAGELRVGAVAVSGLSGGWTNRWITPSEDSISAPEHDRWNRRILELLAAGDGAQALAEREQYAAEAEVDTQLRALPLVEGWAGGLRAADVRAYGPVWGTGAAVIVWPTTNGGQAPS